jgi:O-antigen/teichoic acid export membrane protein
METFEKFGYSQYRSYIKRGGDISKYEQMTNAISQKNRDILGLTVPILVLGTVIAVSFAVTGSFVGAIVAMLTTWIVWFMARFYLQRKFGTTIEQK